MAELGRRLRRLSYQLARRAGAPYHRTRGAETSRGTLKLDWLLCRGLTGGSPSVVAAVDRETGAALSDHEAIVATFSPAGSPTRLSG